MDDFAHARRSPAVRARHFGKRMLNDVSPRDGSQPFLSPFLSITAGDFSTDPAFLPLHTSTSDVVQTPEPTSVPATTSTPSTTPTSTSSSSSSSSSSTTTITVTSTVLPTSTASLPTITTSSTSAIVSTPSAGNNVANANGSSSKGISGGAIAAIVTIVIVGLLAIGFFFVRRKYIKNRQSKRATWGAGAFAKHTELAPPPVEKGYSNTPGVGPRYEGGNDALSARAYGGILSYVEDSQPLPSAFGQHAPQANLTPPPMSYNSTDSQSIVHPPSLSPGMGGAAAVGMERTSAVASSNATIKCTFIPSLPDELSITTGETVRVLAEYDDGWTMCVNTRGEQGMVPIECLERGSVEVYGNTDWRNSKRTSSLPPARY